MADIVERAADDVGTDGPPDVSIAEVAEQSLWIKQRLSQRARTATLVILTALNTGDYSGLPSLAHKRLVDLSKLLIGQGRVAIFSGVGGLTAEISASRPVPELKPRLVRHRTTLYGHVVYVGGIKGQKATLVLVNTGKPKDIDVDSVDLVKELAKRLYDVVGVRGTAWTDMRTGDAESFVAESLTPYRGKSADSLAALDRLAVDYPDVWRDVDIPAYVSSLRDGEDD